MTFIILLVFVIVLIGFNSRIKALERKVHALSEGKTMQAHPMPAPVATSTATPVQSVTTDSVREVARTPGLFEIFTTWIREDWVLKLGAFVLLLGVGWFVSYAFVNNWIGEFGRVTLGVLFGVSVLAFGYHRMHLYVRQGSVFLGLGAMVILLSVFVAAYGYKIVSPHFSLILALLTMAFTALASVRFQVKSLAVVSIIIASLAPTTLLLAGSPSNVELFMYLFVVLLGAMWVVSITGWRELVLVGLAMYFLYAFPRFFAFGHGGESLLLISYAFAILFFVVNTFAILKADVQNIKHDLIAAGVNGILLLMAIGAYVSPEWRSLVMAGWMIVFLVGAFSIFIATKRREPFFVYAGVAIMMLGAATASELEGAALTIAYIFEATTIPVVAYLVMHERKISEGLVGLIVIPGILSLESVFDSWRSSVPFDHFFVLLLMSGSMILLALFFKSIPQSLEDAKREIVMPALFVIGSVYGYILLWLTLHARTVIASYDTATMVCLVTYTIIGLMAYAYGRLNDHKGIRYYGSGILMFTIAHLLLVDVRDMALSGRIVTFLLVGGLLMGTAFIGRSSKTLETPQV